jgi:hypothetical protein
MPRPQLFTPGFLLFLSFRVVVLFSSRWFLQSTLNNTYRRCSSAEVESAWTELYDTTLKYCTHGPKCKVGKLCTHGRRIHTVNILGGHVSKQNTSGCRRDSYSAAAGRLTRWCRSLRSVSSVCLFSSLWLDLLPRCALQVLAYLSDLAKIVQRVERALSYNERQLKVVRVNCDDDRRLVGLQVPTMVIDLWIEEIVAGTMRVSRGLGVSQRTQQQWRIG